MTSLTFRRLAAVDRPDFMRRLQESFTLGAAETFGSDGSEPVISTAEIQESIDRPGADSWDIRVAGEPVGGAIVSTGEDGRHGSLDLLFVDPTAQGRGLGGFIWSAIEALYPDVELWKTITPYSDKRNVHFYINKCGFQAVEFFHPGHPDPNEPGRRDGPPTPPGEMLAFEKVRAASIGDAKSIAHLTPLTGDAVEFRFDG